MPVDLTGILRGTIRSLLADAEAARDFGKTEQEAAAYRQVALVYRRWANETGSAAVRRRFLSYAEEFAGRAGQTAFGPAQTPGSRPVLRPPQPQAPVRVIAPTPARVRPGVGATSQQLAVPAWICLLMEMRAEGSFRPNEPDVEVAYCMSGHPTHTVDRLHQLASSAVVANAGPDSVGVIISRVLEEVLNDRGAAPGLFVDAHTHPEAINLPSDMDLCFFNTVSRRVAETWPGTRVVFAVHAVSSEGTRRRLPPAVGQANEIVWSSIYREHRVGFYLADGSPCGVRLS